MGVSYFALYKESYELIIMFSRMIYLANIRTRVHVRNVCLVVMFAFPCFVYFLTPSTIALDVLNNN